MLTLIFVSLLVAFIIYNVLFRDKRKTPPEPFGFPIIGHLFFIGVDAPMKYTQWAKKCGKIMQIRMGFMTQVVLDDPELVKEAYNDISLSGMAELEFLKEFNGGKNGISFNDGATWEEQRRFTMWHMRDFGFGKKAVMENKIMDEVKDLLDWFKREEKKAISVERMFNVAVLNSLWGIITGHRYSQDDPQVTLLIDNFNKAMEKMVSRFVVVLYAGLAKKIPGISGYGQFHNAVKDLKDFFAHLIKEHKKDLVENNPRDFIDAYLDEINRTINPKSSFYKAQGEESLKAVVFDLFQGGFSTVSATMNWSVLYLSSYPAVQKKFQEEIDSVIGKSRLPSLDDKANMPFTEALMMEVFRKSALIGLIHSHTAMKDITIQGYEIKKGTAVVANVYSIHHNPEIWGDPDNFRPERFLDAKGNCIRKHPALMPFSVGKRACIGESLARDEYFLFLVSIFQRFSIQLDPNLPKPSLVPSWRGTLVPQEYKVIVEDRL